MRKVDLKPENGANPIGSIVDILDQVQDEITLVKNGSLSESAARVVFRGRAVQLKVAELMLQHARLMKGKIPADTQRLLSGEAPPKGTVAEPQRG